MASPTTNYAFVPNAQYDTGPNAAACGKDVPQATLQSAIPTGLLASGVLNNSLVRVGFNAAGNVRTNTGPNAAGQPRLLDNAFG